MSDTEVWLGYSFGPCPLADSKGPCAEHVGHDSVFEQVDANRYRRVFWPDPYLEFPRAENPIAAYKQKFMPAEWARLH